jgi:hypothetical protein
VRDKLRDVVLCALAENEWKPKKEQRRRSE